MLRRLFLGCLVLFISQTILARADETSGIIELHTRSRQAVSDSSGESDPIHKTVAWDRDRTALIVIDMWDDHWCKGAAARVVELAGPMNEFVAEARQRGVFVAHCPSTCVDFYKGTPARRRAMDAPFSKPPIQLATKQRWGTAWSWPDPESEPDLPIDDSDMGCDCDVKCPIAAPWKRQIATIEIDHGLDAITHDGQELYNLFQERGIENVMVCGVHLNMCVLGRPFAIRQMVKLGKNVVLVRDMTDTMYNHKRRPYVDHFAGTDLVVEHVERYWCPSIESTDLVGGSAFRFAEDRRASTSAGN